MIFAVPHFDDLGILVPATNWYWDDTAPGYEFVAVDGDVEVLEDWFPDIVPDRAPDRVAYPINELPPVGSRIIWMDENGQRQEKIVTPDG